MKRLVVLAVVAVVAVMVQIDCTMAADAPSMEQVLLNPQGFIMEWTCGGKSGNSRVFFLRKDEKIIAEIRVIDVDSIDVNNPVNFGAESCTTFQELRDNGIIFFGCTSASWNIPLAYDPGNKKTPFKGSGVNCPKIEFHPY
jgi:hypothetical protein